MRAKERDARKASRLENKSARQMNSQPQIALYVTIEGNVIGNEEYADYVGDVIVAKLRAALGNI